MLAVSQPFMDELAQYNKDRWEALARANVPYSRPWLDLTPEIARQRLDPEGVMDDPPDRDVLCLAGGGGQQSVAFAMLGARVTVLDLCETQLERDRSAARHYGLDVRTIAGDMRDLSALPAGGFDIVYHAHSLGFVPDVGQVLDQVARVIRPGGQYRVDWCNPFIHPIETTQWTGQGYLFNQPIIEGRELDFADPHWDISPGEGQPNVRVVGPREFLHTPSAVINGLIERGFAILGLWECDRRDPASTPGSWSHLASLIPPWLLVWARRNSPCP